MTKKILILAPHTDDGEWGCGASIYKWIKEGHELFYVAFSAAEESVPKHLPSYILREEIINAAEILNINQTNLKVLDFPVRYFPRDRQEILEKMINLRTEINPDIVVVPSSYDTHQDHEVIYQEGFRAFKRSTILGYEIPWNNRQIKLTFFNTVSKVCVEKKIAAMSAYQSQYFRAPNFHSLIESLAIQRGSQIGQSFAEAFEVIRWVEH